MDNRFTKLTQEAQTLQKRLSDISVEQEQKIQNQLGELNKGQVQTHQLIMEQLADQMEQIKTDHRSRIERKI